MKAVIEKREGAMAVAWAKELENQLGNNQLESNHLGVTEGSLQPVSILPDLNDLLLSDSPPFIHQSSSLLEDEKVLYQKLLEDKIILESEVQKQIQQQTEIQRQIEALVKNHELMRRKHELSMAKEHTKIKDEWTAKNNLLEQEYQQKSQNLLENYENQKKDHDCKIQALTDKLNQMTFAKNQYVQKLMTFNETEKKLKENLVQVKMVINADSQRVNKLEKTIYDLTQKIEEKEIKNKELETVIEKLKHEEENKHKDLRQLEMLLSDFHGQIDQLKMSKDDLVMQKGRIEGHLEAQKIRLEEIENKVLTLLKEEKKNQEKILALESQEQKLENELSLKMSEYSKLLHDEKSLKEKMAHDQLIIANYEEGIKKLARKSTDLEHLLDKYQTTIAIEEGQIYLIKDQINRLESKKAQEAHNVFTLESQKENLIDENAKWCRVLGETKGQIEIYNNQLEILENKILHFEEEQQFKQCQLTEAHEKIVLLKTELQSLQNERKCQQEIIAKLKEEHQELHQGSEKYLIEISQRQVELKNNNESIILTEKLIENQQINLSQINMDIKNAQATKIKSLEMLSELEHQISNMKEQFKVLDRETKAKEHNNLELELSHHKMIESFYIKVKELAQKMKQYQKKRNEVQKEYKTYQDAIEFKKYEIDRTRNHIQNLLIEQKRLQEINASLTEDQKHIKNKTIELKLEQESALFDLKKMEVENKKQQEVLEQTKKWCEQERQNFQNDKQLYLEQSIEQAQEYKDKMLKDIENEKGMLLSLAQEELHVFKVKEMERVSGIESRRLEEFEAMLNNKRQGFDLEKEEFIGWVVTVIGSELGYLSQQRFESKMDKNLCKDFIKNLAILINSNLFDKKDDQSKPLASRNLLNILIHYINNYKWFLMVFILVVGMIFYTNSMKSTPVVPDVDYHEKVQNLKSQIRFSPPRDDNYRDRFTDNVLYYHHFDKTFLSDDFQSQLIPPLAHLLSEKLLLQDEALTEIMYLESQLVTKLVDIRNELLENNKNEQIQQMRKLEDETEEELMELFQTSTNFKQYRNFLKLFFLKYKEHKKPKASV